MKKITKQQIILAIAAVVLIIAAIVAGVYYNQSVTTTTPVAVEQVAKPQLVNNTLTYSGKDGVTALVLLQQNATIVTSGTGEMAYVTSINDVAANPTNQYWEFLINDTSASVGAGSYTTKSTDTITWKLSSF
jgi:hypothetical protein